MIIYVVPESPATFAALRLFAGRAGSIVELRQSAKAPTRAAGHEVTFVVMDLTALKWQLVEGPGTRAEGAQYILLVQPRQLIPVEWAEFAHEDGVLIVKIRPRSFDPYADLVARLGRYMEKISVADIADWVVLTEPYLSPVEDMVRAVIEDPWGIRKPVHLARHLGTDRATLHERADLGGLKNLKRVEHFITAVRVFGSRYLMEIRGFGPGKAQRMLGIDNSSNFRKQVRRAGLCSWALAGHRQV